MSEEQEKYGKRLEKLWQTKFNSQKDFTAGENNISRRTLNNMQGGLDALVSTERKIADQMELPKFIVKGFLEGEIDLSDDNKIWTVIKTGQVIEFYNPKDPSSATPSQK